MLEDRLDDETLFLVIDHALDLELGPNIHRQRRAAVRLDNALLPTRTLHLADRQGGNPLVEQLGPDRLERLMSDERFDLLHLVHPLQAFVGESAVCVAIAGLPTGNGPLEAPGYSGDGMNCSG